jgi:EAL domain-containing protein (putative c-di-GMP-specific phosphodiesterase class I)
VTSLLLPNRVDFRPLVDLEAGAVVAIEALAGPAAPDAETDAELAIVAARAAVERESLLPLQLTVRMPTVLNTAAMTRLHEALGALGRRPRGVIISATGGYLDGAITALRDIQRAGYLLGLIDAASLPLGFIAEVAPYLVKIDPAPARRAVADPRASALAEALVALGRRIGTHVLAPGIIADDQLSHMRGLGIRLAQGPLLAPASWRPGMPVTIPVGSSSPASDALGPRVTEFVLPATVIPDTATADEVLTAFNAEPGTSSVVLIDGDQRPVATVDRTRFLLRLAGAYGHALHAHKPAAGLADPPRPIPRTVPAIAALRAAGGDADRVYDDLVVVDEVGRCLGVVRVGDLIRSLAEMDHH